MERRRRLELVVAAWLVLAGCPAGVSAHVGGHEVAPAGDLHVWTTPSTGERVPGAVSFVSGGVVHVEDLGGYRHAWRLEDLVDSDRVVAQRHLARVARLHGRVSAPRPDSVPLWLWFCGAGSAVVLAWRRRGWARPRGAGLVSAGIVGITALACGGSDGTPSAVTPTAPSTLATPTPSPAPAASLASYFQAFPERVRTRQDGQYLYVESDGLAEHPMMAGIRSWQQQVPLPADYTGGNAWSLPLAPRLADQPVSARTGLFRGAIALAVNGVPIFNALNNRGDDAYLFGELDEYGGHAGRADDYHYHTAPLFLSSTVGGTRPIAVALDGFLLYGSLEPDGSPMRALDDYNGHAEGSSYHYHGTRTYPYINGGLKGVVRVTDQVEPQPSVRPVRPALTPLAGATVTRHASTGTNRWTLEYQVGGRTYRLDYRIEGSQVVFVFTDPAGASRTEMYPR